MAQSLFERFMRFGLPAEEVVQIVAGSFRRGSQSTDNQVIYGNESGSSELVLTYDSDDRLVGIETTDELSTATFQSLLDALDEEASETSSHVRRVVLFAQTPVTGWWRHQDELQILPVPDDAPRPGQLVADHPFYLEFRVRRAKNHGVRARRENEAERRYQLLLNALCGRRVRRRISQHLWVLASPFDDVPEQSPKVAFSQSFYSFPSFTAYGDDFSDTSGLPPMEVQPLGVHFSPLSWSVGTPFAVPVSLGPQLTTYASAANDFRGRIYRSAYWLAHSDEVHRLSSSASLAALVQAIEALIPLPQSGPLCVSCNRPIGPSSTAAFHDFVERHAPRIAPSVRRALYKARSAILHGSSLLPFDQGLFNLSALLPEDTQQWRLSDAARAAAQLCILGTMAEQASR